MVAGKIQGCRSSIEKLVISKQLPNVLQIVQRLGICYNKILERAYFKNAFL